MKKQNDLPTLELFFYYAWCLVTLGGVWCIKILIKKAMIEANREV